MRSYSKPVRSGCHFAPPGATAHLLPGRARTDATAQGDYNSGQFRGQAALITKSTGTRFDAQDDEPNPELLGCVWFLLWWGSYTYRRHVVDGGTKSS